MALLNPPAYWDVVSGTWGTDFDESTTVLRSGVRSVWFKNTTPASDPELARSREGWMSVEEGRSYKFDCVVRASSIAGGNTVGMLVDWLDIDEAVISTSTVHNAILNAANAWERKSAVFPAPSNARWAKPRLTKNNTAFHAYFDSVSWGPAKAGLSFYRDSNHTVASGDHWQIPFDNSFADEVDIGYSTGSGLVTFQVPGRYSVIAKVTWLDAFAAGETWTLSAYMNGAQFKVADFNHYVGILPFMADFVEDDELYIRVDNNGGADNDVKGDETWWTTFDVLLVD